MDLGHFRWWALLYVTSITYLNSGSKYLLCTFISGYILFLHHKQTLPNCISLISEKNYNKNYDLLIYRVSFIFILNIMCSLNTYAMFLEYIYYVPWIHILCSLDTYTMFLEYIYYVPWVHILCSLNTYTMFLEYINYVPWIHILYS